MELHDYTFALEPIIQKMTASTPKRIAIQLPEGLKNSAMHLVDFIKKHLDVEIVILADPCFGACDIPTSFLEPFKIDLLLHIGHTPLKQQPKSPIPIEFIPAVATIDITPVIKKAAEQLAGKKIGIVTTAQHLHKLPEIKKILKKQQATPIIGNPESRSVYPGQILGCNFSAAYTIQDKVDVFLYIGNGMFHPLGITLATKKPVYIADPYSQKILKDELDTLKETILRQRYGAIAQATQSQRFGIILSSKEGQKRLATAQHIQKLLYQHNKTGYILIIDRITPDLLMNFRAIQCFISTACPRVAIDDYQQFHTPVLTPIEAEIALGIRQWTDYKFDEITDSETGENIKP